MKIADKIYVILCDDIRQEIGNKMSLMGLYSRDIIFESLPAVLPRLHMVLFVQKIKKPLSRILVTLKMPGNEPVFFKQPGPPDTIVGQDANIALGLSPFKVDKPGKATIEVRINADEDAKADLIHHFELKVR